MKGDSFEWGKATITSKSMVYLVSDNPGIFGYTVKSDQQFEYE